MTSRYALSHEIAAILGRSVDSLRDIIEDRRRPEKSRRFTAKTHATVPACVAKRGGRIKAWLPTLLAHIERAEGLR